MKFLNKLFNKKQKKEDVKERVLTQNFMICGFCEKPIFTDEPRKKFPKGKDSQKYHIKCWRKLIKSGFQLQKDGKN